MSIKTGKALIFLSFCLFLTPLFFPVYFLEAQQRYTRQRYNIYSSDEKNFVWFRVYKAASSTTKEILVKNAPDLVQSRPGTLPKKFNNHFKFAFVRNTWDRVVSCYFDKVVVQRIPEFKECFDKDFDFFVDYIDRLDVSRANSHLKLQTKLIPVHQLNFIGKLDTYSRDLAYVSSIIGLEYEEIPHKLRTDHRHYSTYYTPRTREIIAKKYKEDIDAFGFTFETE